MIVVAVVALGLLVRLALGKPLQGIGAVRFGGEPLLIGAFVLITALPLVSRLVRLSARAVLPVWLGLLLLLACLSLWNAYRFHGFRLIAAGVLLNLTVIAANGSMPVSKAAAYSAGGSAAVTAVSGGDFFHSAFAGSTWAPVLADALPLPGWPGLRGILSVGDVLMYVGLVVVLLASPHPLAQQRGMDR